MMFDPTRLPVFDPMPVEDWALSPDDLRDVLPRRHPDDDERDEQ